MNHREPLNTRFHPAFRMEVQDDWFAITRGKQRKLDGEPECRSLDIRFREIVSIAFNPSLSRPLTFSMNGSNSTGVMRPAGAARRRIFLHDIRSYRHARTIRRNSSLCSRVRSNQELTRDGSRHCGLVKS